MIKHREFKAKSFIDTESLQSSHCTKVSSNEKSSNNINKLKSGRTVQLSSNKSNPITAYGQHKNIHLLPFDGRQEKLKMFKLKVKKQKEGN
jgi:hypothetical protein